MSTFAQELGVADPMACGLAIDWVTSMARRGYDDNEIWKRCTRGDWLLWLLLDAFSVNDEDFCGEWYHQAVASLRLACKYPTNHTDMVELAGLAERVREIFPEWPL